MTTVVKINGDGSGTIDHSLLVTKSALAQLRSFGALRGGPGQPIDLTSEDQARALAAAFGPGVTYLSSTPLDSPLAEGRQSLYAFTDISQVRISQQPQTPGLPMRAPASPASGDITCALTREPGGNAVMHINLPELHLPAAPPGDPAGGGAALAQQMAMVRSLLAGAKILIGVEPAGQLVRTSSPYVDGPRVILLEADLDQVLGNAALISALQAATTPDEIKAAVKNAPGLKINLDREVTIEFTPAR
jgi:hypothetical protein